MFLLVKKIAVLVLLIPSVVYGQRESLKVALNDHQQPAIIVVDKLSSPSTLRVTFSNGKSLKLSSPLTRGVGGLFLLPAGQSAQIDFERRFDITLSVTAVANQLKVPLNSFDTLAIADLQTVYELWSNESSEARLQSLALLKSLRTSVSNELSHQLQINTLMNGMLAQVDTETSAYVEPESGCKNDLACWLERKSFILGKTQFAQFSTNNPDLESLLEQFPKISKVPVFAQLELLDVKLMLGIRRLIAGRTAQDKLSMSSGKELLEHVILKSEEFGDEYLQASALNAVAAYYPEFGDLQSGIKVLERSIALHEKIGVSRSLGDSLNNISWLYRDSGERAKAIDAIVYALRVERKFPERSGRAFLLYQLATIYADVGAHTIAINKFEEAKIIFDSVNDRTLSHLALIAIGNSESKVGRRDEAINNLIEAMRFFQSNDPVGNRSYLRRAVVALAHNLTDNDYVGISISELESWLDADWAYHLNLNEGRPRFFFPAEQLETLIALSDLSLDNSDYSKYLLMTEQIEAIFASVNDPDHPYKRLSFLKLTLRFAKTEMGKAIELTSPLPLIEKIRTELDVAFLGPQWSHKVSSIVDDYISLLTDRANSEEGLTDLYQALEQIASRNLREQRRSTSFKYSLANAKELNTLQVNSMLAETSESKVREWLSVAERKIEALSATKKSRAESSSQQSLSISQLQSNLQHNEIILRLHQGVESSIAMFITKDKVYLHRLEQRATSLLSKALIEVQHYGSRRTPTLRELGGLLDINSVDFDRYKKMIVVADGDFLRLPFEALILKGGKTKSSYLTDKLALVYSPSITEYFRKSIDSVELTNRLDISIFAGPSYVHREQQSAERMPMWRQGLQDLPWASREPLLINDLFPNLQIETVVGKHANRESFTEARFSESKVLHLSTHGFSLTESQDSIGLAVTATPSDPAGLITVFDIYSKRFNNNMIVLSSCDSVLGSLLKGEGMQGLGRAFLAQGAGSVIGTLWPVADRPTYYFMESFYTHLSIYNGDAELALSMTKREMIKRGRFSHPYFWSSFVIYSADKESSRNVFSR